MNKSIEDLIKEFDSHSKEYKKQQKEHKKNFPDSDDFFDLPGALKLMCIEIQNLRLQMNHERLFKDFHENNLVFDGNQKTQS